MQFHTQMEPMVPANHHELEELALKVLKASARLSGRVHPVTAERITKLLRNVNSYYSNLIEGIRTTLLDIESSLHELSENSRTRRLQLLHRHNIAAQATIERRSPRENDEITSPQFLRHIHKELFENVPEEFRTQSDASGQRKIIMRPGTLRDDDVRVGKHVPPLSSVVPQLLNRFHEVYSLKKVHGVQRLICAAASHHRLLWIHPFLEGNGRVARLFSDFYLKCSGVEGYGLWTMSRGLARKEANYKSFLAGADAQRQGHYDGRGNLSEKGLRKFCTFFLETALDQAQFMDDLLKLDSAQKNIQLYCDIRSKGHLAGASPLPKESGAILTHTFIYGKLTKGDVHKLIGVSDRKARDVVKQLLHEDLLETQNQKAPLTIGLPSNAVQFIFPELCDPMAFAIQA